MLCKRRSKWIVDELSHQRYCQIEVETAKHSCGARNTMRPSTYGSLGGRGRSPTSVLGRVSNNVDRVRSMRVCYYCFRNRITFSETRLLFRTLILQLFVEITFSVVTRFLCTFET